MTHAMCFQDIEYIYIQLISYLHTALVMNITKTNLSFLGGQVGENRSQSKNKQEKNVVYIGASGIIFRKTILGGMSKMGK